MSSNRSSLISAVIGLLSASALAAPVWTTGSTTGDLGGFTPAENNLLRGVSPSAVYNNNAGAEGTGDTSLLTDGLYGFTNPYRYTVGNRASLTYVLPNECSYALESINFYSQWNDNGRDKITINSIEIMDESGDWMTIENSSVNYEDESFNCFAKLADSDPNGILGTGAAIRINFGDQENGYVGYLEIEAVGYTAAILELRNPITGSTDVTGTNAVGLSKIPFVADATQYQVTFGNAAPSASAWLSYIPGTIPAGTFDFERPAEDGNVIATAWFRTGPEDDAPTSFSDSIYYTSVQPTLVLRNITLMLGKDGKRTLEPIAVDAGSSDPCGIFSMNVSPSSFTSAGTVPVTFTATNNAGNVSTATATVNVIPFKESSVGTSGKSYPLPQTYFTHLLHLGENFNDEWIDSPGTGGFTADQLENFGGEAHQRPYDGLVYNGVFGANTIDGALKWTEMVCPDPSGRWSPTPDRSNYIKYWHIYIVVPGKEERDAAFRYYNDDGIRVYNNGVKMVEFTDAGGEHVSTGKLFPGLNSITIKLQEGGGGDYMQLRVTDPNGNYFDDLTYQFTPYSFDLADPVTLSTDYTSANTLAVLGFPPADGCAQYQITASTNVSSVSDAGWDFYDSLNPPTSITFALPSTDGEVTNVLWIREYDEGVLVTNSYVDTIVYSTEAPTAAAKDIAIAIDTVEGTVVTPEMIDDGSVGGESGIYSMSVSPARVTGPCNVTLTVMNNAGLTDTATVAVGASMWADVFVSGTGDDDNGTGRPESPYRSISRALEDADPIAGTVYVDAGVYSGDYGESFPLSISSGTRIIGWSPSGTPDRADRVVDGGDSASSLFEFAGGVSGSVIKGLHLCDTTGPIANVDASEATFSDVLFTQSTENYGNAGAIQVSGDGTANADGCEFLAMKRVAVVFCKNRDTGNFNATNCLFNGNTVAYGSIAAPEGSYMHVNVDDSTFVTNTALSQKLHDGQAAACIFFWGVWGKNGSARLDHCRFLGNAGRSIIGASSSSINVRDSLFVDNQITHHIFNGYSVNVLADNCTFIRSGGGFTGYVCDTYLRNCILYDTGVLTHSSSDMSDDATKLRLQNVVLWDTSVGYGYNENGSSNIISDNPWLENVGVAWDDPAFDATLRPYSPAIDAGANAIVFNDTDLADNNHIADNDADGEAIVDLGCFESLFHASPTPVFQIPVPGALYVFKGGTFTTPVSIAPAVDGPVTASISYGEGLNGPATLQFADGSDTVELTVGVNSDCTNEISRLVISESGSSAGVGSAAVDIFPSSNIVTIGGKTKLFLCSGAAHDFTVSFKEEGIVAAEQLAIVMNGPFGAGSNLASWNGNAFIGVGESTSSGRLAVTGGDGVNTIEVTIGGGFVFDETGTDTVIITVIGHPGYLYVDPETGLDSATGTLADPLRTVTFAIGELAAGDEVRMLPGEYDTAQETFPFELSGISLVGCTADGEPVAAAEDCIVTGGDTVDTLVSISGTDAVQIANLTIRESRNQAIFIASTPVTVTNAVFTQTSGNKGVGGAIVQHDNAAVTAIDCVFTNMTRLAAVYMGKYVLNDHHVFTAKNCLFADNDSECATVAGAMEVNTYITLEDCVFRNNAVTQSNSQYSDAFRGQAVYTRNGLSLQVSRCQFLGGREGAVFGMNYFRSQCHIDDSLFAGNYAPAGVFHGYESQPQVRNCTFIGNTGGFNGRYVQPTFFNCIICDGTLSFVPPDGQMILEPGTGLSIHDTILWNVEEGRGYATNSSSNVTIDDPLLKNVSVSWDNPAFDAHPRSNSPAIDGGDNEHGYSDFDLDGDARLQIGKAGAEAAVIDLGCYESETIYLGTLFMIR